MLLQRRVFPSLVTLEMRDAQNKPISTGSGFFVRPGVIATNRHVIDRAADGYARLIGQRSAFKLEGVVAADAANDLVLLRVKGIVGVPLKLGDISKLVAGQTIYAIGSPRGLEGTISQGIISGSNLRLIDKQNLIQITASISPGSSGGPVVGIHGEVLGIAVASLSGGQNLNFAIPASYLSKLINAIQDEAIPLYRFQALPKIETVQGGPSVEETVAWVTKTIRSWYDARGDDVERVEIRDCNLHFQRSGSKKDDGSLFREWKMAQLIHVNRTYTFDDGKAVGLIVGDKSFAYDKGEQFYTDGIRSSWGGPTDQIFFVTSDAKTAIRLKNGLDHLIDLCKQNEKKAPF